MYWKWALSHCKRIAFGLCFVILLWLCIGNIVLNSLENRFRVKSDLERYKFQYLINNDICVKDPYLLILVHSAVDHFRHRIVIRRTWADPKLDLPQIKVAFLLGMTNQFQDAIERENEVHEDIIQGNFVDSYRNLTYKHVMGLSWASTFCNKTKYLMKMDDDIFIDIHQFVDYIANQMMTINLRNNIACYFQTGMPVVRDPVSKWFVSKTEYSPDTFDNYCSGWAYLTTTYVAKRLCEAVKKLPYFWVDDVHLTGSTAKLANISQVRLNHLFALESEGLIDWTRSSTSLKWDKMFAPTWGDLGLSRKAHEKALKCHNMKCNCCYKPPTTPKPTAKSTTVKGVAQKMIFGMEFLHKLVVTSASSRKAHKTASKCHNMKCNFCYNYYLLLLIAAEVQLLTSITPKPPAKSTTVKGVA
ncbi:beta-1,3-galactosyltransferase 5 [Caerostris darwini]|uniref:Hexosyltransferase n=1 Tax=Caerostris darwini TaxID=1538125 RepID=A0AAV4MWD1_9ARAC|nr:beta-1,3-galactosyltransferase 5 [Caerostris darwini]